jgi:hypothetical protein
MWNMNCLTAEACDGVYANVRWYRFIAMIVVTNVLIFSTDQSTMSLLFNPNTRQ